MLPVVTSDSTLSTPSLSSTIVIPARYGAARLPGKPLADLAGRPLIEHVYKRAALNRSAAPVIVATDDDRIADAVAAFGGQARMTRRDHLSGTDRLAEVAADLDCDLVVNVQGDEPLLAPEIIDEAIAPFAHDATLQMATLRRRFADPADAANPHIVKVVVDRRDFALYFSRAAIPYHRSGAPAPTVYKHLGIYVYRRLFLLTLAGLPPTPLERFESLEQLRALEHGYAIKAPETQHDSISVDTPEDLEVARRLIESEVRREP